MDNHPTNPFYIFERTHTQETWEKRVSYIQVVVELVGAASHQKKTHIQSYSDPISHLFQTAVDVCVLGMLQSAYVCLSYYQQYVFVNNFVFKHVPFPSLKL